MHPLQIQNWEQLKKKSEKREECENKTKWRENLYVQEKLVGGVKNLKNNNTCDFYKTLVHTPNNGGGCFDIAG